MNNAHKDIVRLAGKPEEVSDWLGVSVNTVQSWIRRDSIPPEWWIAFVDRGVTSLEELAKHRAVHGRAA